MSKQYYLIKGKYIYKDGEFIPDEGIIEINKKLEEMKMLAGSTEMQAGEFYYDEKEKTYWQYIQYEDYRTELKQVTREYIEINFPTVDCDNLLDVKRD